jgi:Arc/MetJ family transcription regulator
MPKVRTTITIDEAVLAEWQSIARLQRSSLSSAINDWLLDTSEAAFYAAHRMHENGEFTKEVVDKLLVDLAVLSEGHQAVDKAKKGASGGALARRSPPTPPSCNTGGKFKQDAGVRRA